MAVVRGARASSSDGSLRKAPEDWSTLQDLVAARAVSYGAEHSREIGRRLARAGVAPEDVGGVADLRAIPVLTKDELPALQAADPPLGGMLAVSLRSLARIYRSPGPINDPQGTGADFWRLGAALEVAGFRPGEVVLNSFSYHLTPGGLMLDGGLRAAGCVVIPGGVGATAAQIEAARAAGATGYTGTPQFLLTLLERAEESGQPLGFKRALVSGAPLPPSLRARLQDSFGVDVYQAYAAADTGLLGYECAEKDGWHVAPEGGGRGAGARRRPPGRRGGDGAGGGHQLERRLPAGALRHRRPFRLEARALPLRSSRPPPGGFPGQGGGGGEGAGNVRAPTRGGWGPGARPGRGALPGGGVRRSARDVFTVRVEAVPGRVVDTAGWPGASRRR